MKFFSLTSSAVPPTVAGLPSTPFDGQEVYFQTVSMATNGVRWHLAYREAATGNYKWEFVGGGSIRDEVMTGQTTASDTNVDLSGPTITVPLKGVYAYRAGAKALNDSTGGYATVESMNAGVATGVIFFHQSAVLNNAGYPSIEGLVTIAAANDIFKLVYRRGGGGTASFSDRRLSIVPVKVG